MLQKVAVPALVILDCANQVDQIRRSLSTRSAHWKAARGKAARGKAARDQAAWNCHLARWPFTG